MRGLVRCRLVWSGTVGLTCIFTPPTAGQNLSAVPDTVRLYLDSALHVMQANVLGGDSVDWNAFRDSMYLRAGNAEVPVDTYRAIRWALRTLNPHSFLQLSSELRERERMRMPEHPTGAEEASTSRPSLSPFSNERQPEGELIAFRDRTIGRVRVPAFGGSHLTAFADSLVSLARDLDRAGACGWMIDLRGNGGGNMWPMLAGVGPILGDGKIGEFHGPHGVTGTWFLQDGVSGISGSDGAVIEIARVSGEPLRIPNLPPVAVLFDGGTASSGEAVAIAFIGRPNTRSFGVASYGFTTANDGFRMPDGANIVLTVGVDADRNGRIYPGALQPDVEVPIARDGALPSTPPPGIDPQEEAALVWLTSHEVCR